MSNMIKMPIRYTIATLYKQGISKREIARPLAVHRENVNRYLKRMTEKSQPEAPLLVSQEKNVEICEQTDTANDQLSASEWESGVVAGFENQPGAPL